MKHLLALITACLLVSALPPVSGQSNDSIMFEAETLSIASPETEQCVQVGLRMTYRGTENRGWSVLNATLNYSAPAGMLTGTPVARISDFSSESPGLTAPGTNQVNHVEQETPCHVPDIVNSVTLNQGYDVPFAEGFGECDCSESVNAGTGRIEMVAAGRGELLTTKPGREALFAVVTFPVAAGAKGTIDLQFVPDTLVKEGNLLVNEAGDDLTAYTSDGSVTFRGSWPVLSLWHWGLVLFFGGFILSVLGNLRRKGKAPGSLCESS